MLLCLLGTNSISVQNGLVVNQLKIFLCTEMFTNLYQLNFFILKRIKSCWISLLCMLVLYINVSRLSIFLGKFKMCYHSDIGIINKNKTTKSKSPIKSWRHLSTLRDIKTLVWSAVIINARVMLTMLVELHFLLSYQYYGRIRLILHHFQSQNLPQESHIQWNLLLFEQSIFDHNNMFSLICTTLNSMNKNSMFNWSYPKEF